MIFRRTVYISAFAWIFFECLVVVGDMNRVTDEKGIDKICSVIVSAACEDIVFIFCFSQSGIGKWQSFRLFCLHIDFYT